MRFCFVSTSRGSYFMTELLAALASATEAAGHGTELVFDEFPPHVEDRIYVVVPHEFEAWGMRSGFPDDEQRARTIALCTENPGTEWFEATYRLVADFGAAVSINRSSAAELRRRGVRCEHLQLGYVARWDAWQGDESAERTIDVLYLGAADPRRDPLLAGIGATLWARDCQFLVPPLEPRIAPRPDFLKGHDKYSRLAQSKILLNLHRTTSAALEWMRFLEAICNGCVVVSEPSLDEHPLIAGEHFVCAPVEQIAVAIEDLLEHPERQSALREQAYRFVREQLPMEPAGRRLVELAGELPRSTTRGTASPDWAQALAPPIDVAEQRSPSRIDLSAVIAPPGDPSASGRDTPGRAEGPLRHAIRRRLRVLGRPRSTAITETPSYAAAQPRVSVLSVITGARACQSLQLLESVLASRDEELEVVAIATESSALETARFLAAHPTVPIAMLGVRATGLGAARNLLAERARGEHVLALPLEGGVFPSTVARLTRALTLDPLASFSYPMIAVVDGGTPVGLRGSMPWEAQRLARESWIDAPMLIRHEWLLELGGYATDARLGGLEDLDLLCRIADASGHGVHVPQVLAWQPARADAQPCAIALLAPASAELLHERSPHVFAERSDR
jgi:hypothetical protein